MTAALRFPKPLPKRKPLKDGQHRRSYIRAKRARRLDREDREVMVNAFDGTGPRIEIKEGHDEARLAWVRTQACELAKEDPTHRCEGRIEACHEATKPGLGMKCGDSGTMAMCSLAHRWWTRHTGYFAGWTRERRRSWADDKIAATTSRYLSAGSRRTS